MNILVFDILATSTCCENCILGPDYYQKLKESLKIGILCYLKCKVKVDMQVYNQNVPVPKHTYENLVKTYSGQNVPIY